MHIGFSVFRKPGLESKKSQTDFIRQPAVDCEENWDEDAEFVFARFVACQIHA